VFNKLILLSLWKPYIDTRSGTEQCKSIYYTWREWKITSERKKQNGGNQEGGQKMSTGQKISTVQNRNCIESGKKSSTVHEQSGKKMSTMVKY